MLFALGLISYIFITYIMFYGLVLICGNKSDELRRGEEMRYIISVHPYKGGFEIRAKRETSYKDKAMLLNVFNVLTDAIDTGIYGAFGEMKGVKLSLAGETGLLKAMEEKEQQKKEDK